MPVSIEGYLARIRLPEPKDDLTFSCEMILRPREKLIMPAQGPGRDEIEWHKLGRKLFHAPADDCDI